MLQYTEAIYSEDYTVMVVPTMLTTNLMAGIIQYKTKHEDLLTVGYAVDLYPLTEVAIDFIYSQQDASNAYVYLQNIPVSTLPPEATLIKTDRVNILLIRKGDRGNKALLNTLQGLPGIAPGLPLKLLMHTMLKGVDVMELRQLTNDFLADNNAEYTDIDVLTPDILAGVQLLFTAFVRYKADPHFKDSVLNNWMMTNQADANNDNVLNISGLKYVNVENGTSAEYTQLYFMLTVNFETTMLKLTFMLTPVMLTIQDTDLHGEPLPPAKCSFQALPIKSLDSGIDKQAVIQVTDTDELHAQLQAAFTGRDERFNVNNAEDMDSTIQLIALLLSLYVL